MENHGERNQRSPIREQTGVRRRRKRTQAIEEDGLDLTLGLQPFSASSQRQLRVRFVPLTTLKRARHNTTTLSSTSGKGKSETVPIPFPWATDRRAEVHSMEYLVSKDIDTIIGEVECRKCEKHYELGFDLKEKFQEIGDYIFQNKISMKDRAPPCWERPVLPNCTYCQEENSVHPVIAKKKAINWLFLFLGQMLGCCNLDQLKYFCKHNKCHRTGAKNRLLYSTYIGLCNQLLPDGPFSYP